MPLERSAAVLVPVAEMAIGGLVVAPGAAALWMGGGQVSERIRGGGGSELAREILRCMDTVEFVRDHYPILIAIGTRAPRDRNCRWLTRAWETHKRTREAASGLDREHDVVERVDRTWEQRNADELRDHSDGRKRRFATDRRATRAGMPLAELLRLTIQALAAEPVLSTVPAGNIEPTRGNGDGASLQHQQALDDDPRYRYAQHQLRHWTEQLLGLQEESRGLGVVAGAVLMLAEHKDVEILKLEGPSPRDVVNLLGSQVAGSARTVERVRIEASRCRWCGQRMPGE